MNEEPKYKDLKLSDIPTKDKILYSALVVGYLIIAGLVMWFSY